MKKYLYIALLTLPMFSYAMEKKPPKPKVVELRLATETGDGTAGAHGRRKSLPILSGLGNLFRGGSSSAIPKTSTGSFDDYASLDSGSPRTPKSAETPRGSMRLTRSSDGTMSPRFNVVFDSTVAARRDDNTHVVYQEFDGHLVPILDEDDDDAPTSPPIKYEIDPDGRNNPHYTNPKHHTCKSPDTLPADVVERVLQAEGQCPVGSLSSTRQAGAIVSPKRARRVKSNAQRAAAVYAVSISEDSDERQDAFIPQDPQVFTYRVDYDDDVDLVAAAAESAELASREIDPIDACIAMVSATRIATKRDSDDDSDGDDERALTASSQAQALQGGTPKTFDEEWADMEAARKKN